MTDRVTIERFIYCLEHEYRGAMAKFPGNRCNTTALMEEVGELSQALFQLEFEPHKNKTRADVFREAIQVAAMAMKIALNGDSSFPSYEYEYDSYSLFYPTGSLKPKPTMEQLEQILKSDD